MSENENEKKRIRMFRVSSERDIQKIAKAIAEQQVKLRVTETQAKLNLINAILLKRVFPFEKTFGTTVFNVSPVFNASSENLCQSELYILEAYTMHIDVECFLKELHAAYTEETQEKFRKIKEMGTQTALAAAEAYDAYRRLSAYTKKTAEEVCISCEEDAKRFFDKWMPQE